MIRESVQARLLVGLILLDHELHLFPQPLVLLAVSLPLVQALLVDLLGLRFRDELILDFEQAQRLFSHLGLLECLQPLLDAAQPDDFERELVQVIYVDVIPLKEAFDSVDQLGDLKLLKVTVEYEHEHQIHQIGAAGSAFI